MEPTQPRRKKVRSSKLSQDFFQSHKRYAENSASQRAHNRELALMISKSAYPLSIIYIQYFLRYMHLYDPRTKIPNRPILTDIIVPKFMDECFDKYVKLKLKGMDSVSLSFDLWMRRGCGDVFDLMVHRIDKSFRQHQVYLRMPECSSSKGVDLAAALKPELKKHYLPHQITACIKDGGSNIKNCTQIVREITNYRAMGLDMCFFDGVCFAHIASAEQGCSGCGI